MISNWVSKINKELMDLYIGRYFKIILYQNKVNLFSR